MKELIPYPSDARRMGKQVDTIVNYKVQLSTRLYWDKDDNLFSAMVEGQRKSDRDPTVVRKWANDMLASIGAVSWKPVISVMRESKERLNYNGQDIHYRTLQMSHDRFLAAELADGSVRVVDWDVKEEDRLRHTVNSYCWPRDHRLAELPFAYNEFNFFPYTEEMWAGLCAIADAIEALGLRLQALLNDKDAQRIIQDAGAKTLKLLMQ